MTQPKPPTQVLRDALLPGWAMGEESLEEGPLALNGEPSRFAWRDAPLRKSGGLMGLPARLAEIIESACRTAPCFGPGLCRAFEGLRIARRGVALKAQLRDVSGAVPGVGESQRGADFRDCFALGHKGFTASIQVTY
jgi:hypothetical protein